MGNKAQRLFHDEQNTWAIDLAQVECVHLEGSELHVRSSVESVTVGYPKVKYARRAYKRLLAAWKAYFQMEAVT